MSDASSIIATSALASGEGAAGGLHAASAIALQITGWIRVLCFFTR